MCKIMLKLWQKIRWNTCHQMASFAYKFYRPPNRLRRRIPPPYSPPPWRLWTVAFFCGQKVATVDCRHRIHCLAASRDANMRFCQVMPTSTSAKSVQCRLYLAAHETYYPSPLLELPFSKRQTAASYDKKITSALLFQRKCSIVFVLFIFVSELLIAI